MTAAPLSARAVSTVALIGGLLCAIAGCGTGTSASSASAEGTGAKSAPAQSRAAWQEPAAYTYTLRSSEGERALIGAFRITVRDGAVAEAVGLDDSGRRVVEGFADAVPTIGELLDELAQARRDGADTAEAQYAADGHPVRISLDWEESAIDDEAVYVISAYEPADGQVARPSPCFDTPLC
ncbi:DUF6174 domain-containing protein [Streptomyces curacoi]|uniref:Lipoprotein n=1 Tax=Streptomyces curacoi TaxID=146536 RepID=A0A117PCD6_9ACTN|nr:DUF6174 domain-containing protein [Streptomyces curacoi]KUM77137.1 hypothetical protein AQI70_14485 [Streptomyces curacoi]